MTPVIPSGTLSSRAELHKEGMEKKANAFHDSMSGFPFLILLRKLKKYEKNLEIKKIVVPLHPS